MNIYETHPEKPVGIKYCRSCYDHLAGYVGVKMTESCINMKSYPDSVVAPVQKLRLAGYVDKMWTLENAINDLVKNYLSGGAIL
ncbi:MAG: hypothetical protein J0H55_09390 [Chitinophagaceae bacterium]|nr:hypothetical protein [Chitinophagaceae bacterium]